MSRIVFFVGRSVSNATAMTSVHWMMLLINGCNRRAVIVAVCLLASLGCVQVAANDQQVITRHRASTSMYSLTFFVRFLLPERHQRKPTVQAAAVMLRTPPVDGQSPASQLRPLPIFGAQFRRPPSRASQRPAARADPAQPAVRTMSSYRGMDASL